MNKFLLLFLFVCVTATGMAQVMVDRTDTTYVTNSSNGASNALNLVITKSYNADCRLDTSNYTFFDYYTQQPNATARRLYTYYPDGDLHENIYQRGGPDSGTLTNQLQTVSTYIAPGRIDNTARNLWNGSQWVPSSLEVYEYTPDGKPTLQLSQYWSNDHNAYINSIQYLHEYDENGNETFYSMQHWDTTRNEWIINYEYNRAYDSSHYLISESSRAQNPVTYIIQPYSHTDYYNDSTGLADSSFTLIYSDSSYTKTAITYFPNSNQFQYRYLYNYTSDSVLTGSEKQMHFIDTSGYRVLDSTTYASLDVNSGEYLLSLTVYNFTDRNEDSTLRITGSGNAFYNQGTLTGDYSDRTESQYTPCGSVLPVTLLSFTASKQKNNAVLQWTTANETNTASFFVQRSTDGVHFTRISTVGAAGNSRSRRYAYTDFNISQLGAATIYYRLIQQDVNGVTHNSGIAHIDITGGNLIITLSPNPVRNSIGIYSPVAMPDAIIRIADMSGKVVFASRSNIAAGNRISIDASSFGKGVYYTTVQWAGGRQVVKLVKE